MAVRPGTKPGKMVVQDDVEINVRDDGSVHIKAPQLPDAPSGADGRAHLNLSEKIALTLFDLLGDVISWEPHPDEE